MMIQATVHIDGDQVVSVWEPTTTGPSGHSTIRHIEGRPFGRIGTERLPAELDALPPRSEERYAAVKAWHAARYERAYAMIESAYPAAIGGHRSMGEVRIAAP